MRKGALTIEWFTKHTKELRHEDRVQQDDSDWLFCSKVASTEEALMHCMDSCSHTHTQIAKMDPCAPLRERVRSD